MLEPIFYWQEREEGLDRAEVYHLIRKVLDPLPLKAVLIVGPDYTRRNSWGGQISGVLYEILSPRCRVDFLEATGTHAPMSARDRVDMYPDIPPEHYYTHNWREDVIPLGTIPANTIQKLSHNILQQDIPVQINKRVVDKGYDLILSVGQVLPHAVAGMANYSKNLIVGTGGAAMIDATHLIGAYYGMERIMGRDHTPARELMDYAYEQYLKDIPILFLQTVVATDSQGQNMLYSLAVSTGREAYEYSVANAQRKNIIWLKEPLKTAVAYLEPGEFHSTWTANKAIHRLKMAMAPGGTLVVVAPGVHCFSEDQTIDHLIGTYGYCGKAQVIALREKEEPLKKNLAAAAHLIHGSTDGKFTVYYHAPRLGKEKIEAAGYQYITEEALRERFGYPDLRPGMQTHPTAGELYYIPSPELGLWAVDSSQ